MPGNSTGELILIVDDEASYRFMLRGLLQKKGFRVVEAENGFAGVEAAILQQPNLILMDVNMPLLKGSDALKMLKERPETREIPVIVVSAREDSDDLLICFRNGASDYVRKVFHHEELLARIQTHLDIAKLRVELLAANSGLQSAHDNLVNNLRYAGEIQRALLVQTLPQAKDLEFACRYIPCEDTSGDYYSAFWLDEENIGICIADASGHGVGAAMLAVFLKGQLESLARQGGGPKGPLRDPAEVALMVNRTLCAKQFGREFITAIYGILHLPKMEFRFVNAGHPYPVVLRADGRVTEIQTENTVLGLFPEEKFIGASVIIEPGDTLLLYTDGITEAVRAHNEQYGIERLSRLMEMSAGMPPEELAERIVHAVTTYQDGHQSEDDVTLFLMSRKRG